jgi:hypothetical protein
MEALLWLADQYLPHQIFFMEIPAFEPMEATQKVMVPMASGRLVTE